MEKISVRLNKALNFRNMKPIELAEKTGIDKGSISSYLSGRYDPKSKNIYKIAKVLNINPTWLLGYDIPMIENEMIKIHENDRIKLPLNIGPYKKNEEINIYYLISIIDYFYSVMNEMKELYDKFVDLDENGEEIVYLYRDQDAIINFISLFNYLHKEMYEISLDDYEETDVGTFDKLNYYTKIVDDFQKLQNDANLSKELKHELKNLNDKAKKFIENQVKKEKNMFGKIFELVNFNDEENQDK